MENNNEKKKEEIKKIDQPNVTVFDNAPFYDEIRY